MSPPCRAQGGHFYRVKTGHFYCRSTEQFSSTPYHDHQVARRVARTRQVVMDLLHHAPQFSPQLAAALAREHFGLDGCRVTPLPSERDQNFLLELPGRDSRASESRFVLKIANALEDPAFL